MKKNEGEPFGDIEKISKKSKNEIFGQCHSAEKCKRGDLSEFLNLHFIAKH